jgi:hypothetical protein
MHVMPLSMDGLDEPATATAGRVVSVIAIFHQSFVKSELLKGKTRKFGVQRL